MKLPTAPVPAKMISPATMLIYGPPKVGKSTILAELTTKFAPGEALHLSLEKGGLNMLESVKVDCYPDKETTDLQAFEIFKEACKAIRESSTKYKYLIVDTITTLDNWSYYQGTIKYMNSTQGKTWNRHPETGEVYKRSSPNWRPVTELGNGYGWRYPREFMQMWLERLSGLAEHVIFVAHIKDKYITTDAEADSDVYTFEINLTGKLKNILTAEVDAIARIFRDGNSCYFSFDNSSALTGSRSAHLQGDIEISKMTDKGVEVYWERIFPDQA